MEPLRRMSAQFARVTHFGSRFSSAAMTRPRNQHIINIYIFTAASCSAPLIENHEYLYSEVPKLDWYKVYSTSETVWLASNNFGNVQATFLGRDMC